MCKIICRVCNIKIQEKLVYMCKINQICDHTILRLCEKCWNDFVSKIDTVESKRTD